jgi:integrase
MRRGLPRYVYAERKKGRIYFYFRVGKGARIPMPDPRSPEFGAAYASALAKPAPKEDEPNTIGALITSYLRSAKYLELKPSSRRDYRRRVDRIRSDHGHRTVAGMTPSRITTSILEPFAGKPGAKLDTLKKLRILIKHAIEIGWLDRDPSVGIKRPKTKEIRAWTDAEMAAFERRWPLGTRQRTAYALMLYMGTARVDVHELTWHQVDEEADYTRHKTGVHVRTELSRELKAALAATPRNHVTIINTLYGKPFTIGGFSQWMRGAIKAAGLPLDCQPHGLRKTLGRLMADAGCTAHEIMASLGHTTLAEAERYTREANRHRGATRAISKLDDHIANKTSPTTTAVRGNDPKTKGKSNE